MENSELHYQANQPESPSLEKRDFKQRNIESYLNYVLEVYEPFDEGQDGIIGLIDVQQITAELREYLLENQVGDEEIEKFAVKLLKIYSHGEAAKREAGVHKAALLALREAGEKDDAVAQTPEIYFADAVELGKEDTTRRLKNEGVQIGPDNKVDMLIMDFIPGQNLATYLYTEAARRHPELQNLYHDLEAGVAWHFNDIVKCVNGVLANTPDNGDLEMFYKHLYEYLYKEGFVLDAGIVRGIDKAVEVLHNNEIHHNDLHERNVIVNTAPDGTSRPYIIDYGRSTVGEKIDIVQRTERHLMDDAYIHNRYFQLTLPLAERARKANQELYQGSLNLEGQKLKAGYDELLEKMEAHLAEPSSEVAFYDVISEIDKFLQTQGKLSPYTKAESFWQTKIKILATWVDGHQEFSDALLGYITDSLQRDKAVGTSLPVQNFLRRIKNQRGGQDKEKSKN